MRRTKVNMIAAKPVRKRDLWVCPFSEYSCGGYYLAERFPEGGEYHLNGQVYNDNMCFWLLSGRMEVMSLHQAERAIGYCRERGEEVTVTYADSLPEGARWLNVR